eukprot:COSAG06_NODE_1775_length_8426_cov_4.369761_10_plen_72_part_00
MVFLRLHRQREGNIAIELLAAVCKPTKKLPFYTKIDRFTKTGSGQTQEKLKTNVLFQVSFDYVTFVPSLSW